jgi:hypothetical protein
MIETRSGEREPWKPWGSFTALRPDRPTDPQPWTYDVTFAPSARDLLPYETTLNPLSAVWARGRQAEGAPVRREPRNATR